MATKSHPTRAEWETRQDRLPRQAKDTLDRIRDEADRERETRERMARARAAEADEWRLKFEAAVAAVLVANGCEWLASYRVPDHEALNLPVFDPSASHYFAFFDPSAVGCWPVALHMAAGDGHRREWLPASAAAWRVYRPSGTLTYREWLTAFAFALTYTTPF